MRAKCYAMYLDYMNNFCTLEGFADYYHLDDCVAKRMLKIGRIIAYRY